jgi:beta-lactam-binding protein with PASTA domain
VTVNVSSGAANINLPNLQGQQAGAAQSKLSGLGFTNVSEVPDPQSTAPQGTVDRQTPGAGSYPPNQAITLYVSGGGVAVPNVVNDTAAVAEATLTQAGFQVTENSTPAPADQMVQPGTVYQQTPDANTIQQKGSSVTIFIQPENATPTTSPTDTGQPTTSPTDTGQPTTSPTDTGSPTATPTDGTTGVGGILPTPSG